MAKLYRYNSVFEYVHNCDTVADMDTIEGGLLDTYILYHDCGVIEIFEEVYLNEWSSAYARHIYRKGLPKKWRAAIESEWARREAEEAETAYYEALQSGTFDIAGAMV